MLCRRKLQRMSESDEEPKFVLVPADALSADVLGALIEEFVTREGTEYGLRDYTLQEKTQAVRRQIEGGQVLIAFDVESESTTLVPRAELPRALRVELESE
jgi:uncharacterized protein YheU (UPF0270 family)